MVASRRTQAAYDAAHWASRGDAAPRSLNGCRLPPQPAPLQAVAAGLVGAGRGARTPARLGLCMYLRRRWRGGRSLPSD